LLFIAEGQLENAGNQTSLCSTAQNSNS